MDSLPTAEVLVERLRGGVERALLESNRGAVDKAEAAEVARQVILGRGLPERIADRIGDRPACTLVAFDADRIQTWVFASERIQVAAGASHTLEHLNAEVEKIPETKEGLFRKTGVRKVYGVVYSAGGGGMLVADGRQEPEVLEEEVKRWLEERSRGLTFTVVAEPLTARDLQETGKPRELAAADGNLQDVLGGLAVLDGLGGALTRLMTKVRERKDSRPALRHRLQFQPGPGGVLERCPSCRSRPPGKTPVEGDGPESWCGHCQSLRRSWKEAATDDPYARVETFEDLAGASQLGRGYLAFISLDGNSMGSVFRGVRSLLQLRAFSEATTAIYENARSEAVRALGGGYLRAEWTPDQAHLSLLSGGDEITLVLPSSAAPEVTTKLLRAVEQGFETACAPGGLLREAFQGNPKVFEFLRHGAAAAGMVIARPSFPVRLLRRYAMELQAEAKRACALDGVRSGVAWLLLTDSSPLPEGLEVAEPLAELDLVRFDQRLAEAQAALAEDVRLPGSALQRLIEHGRTEEDGIRSLGPGDERNDVLGLLLANFFRYQLTRSKPLCRWWRCVSPESEGSAEAEVRAVQSWFREGGLNRLERLVELVSLEPLPRPEGRAVEQDREGRSA